MDARSSLLREWARYVRDAAYQGALTGKPCPISRIEIIAGPRAGALEVYAGMGAGKLLKALSGANAATLRQFVPWAFVGAPQVFMRGRSVRLEAGWPEHLARTMIRLGELGCNPKRGGWVAGQNERGQTVCPRLDDRTPHFLVSGTTGSGKSVALRNAVLQLSRDPANCLVLIDGKYGESLNRVAHLRGVVGPVAVDGPDVRAALGWVCAEMRWRYERGGQNERVIVVFDEIQEFVGDMVIVNLMKRIAAQGRAAQVHLLAATQHPTVDAFGDASTRRNLTGKLALRVGDPDASRVAVGGNTPRADYLLGAGDAYAVGPGVVHRIQGAYVDGRDIGRGERGEWMFEEWPEYDALDIGQTLPEIGGVKARTLKPSELGASLIAAMEGEGRPTLKDRIEQAGMGRPGSDYARWLLKVGRETLEWLESQDVGLCYLTD